MGIKIRDKILRFLGRSIPEPIPLVIKNLADTGKVQYAPVQSIIAPPAAPPKPMPFSSPFIVTADKLLECLAFVKEKGEVNVKYVFDKKKGILALGDLSEDLFHDHIARAVWRQGYHSEDLAGGNIYIGHAAGTFRFKIFGLSTAFSSPDFKESVDDRVPVMEHIKTLLSNTQAEIAVTFEGLFGLEFTVILP